MGRGFARDAPRRPFASPARLLAVFSPACLLVGCVTTVEPEEQVWIHPKTEVKTFDPAGRETSGKALGNEVWRIDPEKAPPLGWDAVREATALPLGAPTAPAGTAGQDPAGQDPGGQDPGGQDSGGQDSAAQQAEEKRRREEALIRTQFGDAVMIGADGSVTKQYFLSGESGRVFLALLTPLVGQAAPAPVPPAGGAKFGGEQTDSVLGRMLGPDNEIEIFYVPDFEQITDMGTAPKPGLRPVPIIGTTNSLVLVTAKPSALAAFEQALNLFYANIPQIEIEVKVVEYGTLDTLNFGVTTIDGNTPTLANMSSGQLVQGITSDFPLTAPFVGSTAIRDQGLITLGGIHDSWELNAVLQLLETNNIADVQTQPKMVVRNGGFATITTLTEQPYPKAKISNQTTVATDIAFKDIGVVMHIRPEIAGTNTVILLVQASVSAVTGFANTDPPTPIVSTREATTSVHLREGQTTVIGGLVAQSIFELESKVPILGDIPILGYLFRSTSSQKSKTMLEFHITPRILTGPRGDRPTGLGTLIDR